MEHLTDDGQETEHPPFLWLELATGFYNEVTRLLTGTRAEPDKTEKKPQKHNDLKDKFRTYETWKTGIKNLNSFIQAMIGQENQETFLESMGMLIEFLIQITADSSENILEFQGQLLNSISKIGKHTKAYNLDEIDPDIFESFRKLYENEFQKYHYIPKLGLLRSYLEQISVLIDKFNIYYSYLGQLSYLFFVPIEKTNRIMLAKIDEMMNHEDFIKDSGALYNEWIKILEEHYMTVLQTTEYTEVLKKTIDSLVDYRQTKNKTLCLILKKLPIATNDEMDDVYKELYMVKKQIKKLSNQVNQLTTGNASI